MTTTCSYRDCDREARKGWTTCNRHYTAGHCRAQAKQKQAAKATTNPKVNTDDRPMSREEREREQAEYDADVQLDWMRDDRMMDEADEVVPPGTTPDTMIRRANRGRDDARRKALAALAGYKFWMFGYHAAQWVLLNRVIGDSTPNPFRFLVQAAREELDR